MEAENSPVLNHHSQGIYRFSNWKKEGDGLLIAAQALRQQWLLNKEEVKRIITDQAPRSPEVFTKDLALARSSMLLLGYAAEMYLKGGLVKLYRYCPEQLVGRELRMYSHHYQRLAKRLQIPITENQFDQLSELEKALWMRRGILSLPPWMWTSSRRLTRSPAVTMVSQILKAWWRLWRPFVTLLLGLTPIPKTQPASSRDQCRGVTS